MESIEGLLKNVPVPRRHFRIRQHRIATIVEDVEMFLNRQRRQAAQGVLAAMTQNSKRSHDAAGMGFRVDIDDLPQSIVVCCIVITLKNFYNLIFHPSL